MDPKSAQTPNPPTTPQVLPVGLQPRWGMARPRQPALTQSWLPATWP